MSDTGAVDLDKRRFLTNSTAVIGGIGAAAAAVPFLASWKPSARAEAAGAPVEVDLSKLQPGERITIEWRGKPVWVLRRTPETLAALNKDDAKVADPASDKPQQPSYAQNQHRSINPEFLVLVGLCTHLGCVPVFQPEVTADWNGGFYCPCHGSRFDLAGRVFKSVPAPINLEVPPYQFLTDTRIVIGEDGGVA